MLFAQSDSGAVTMHMVPTTKVTNVQFTRKRTRDTAEQTADKRLQWLLQLIQNYFQVPLVVITAIKPERQWFNVSTTFSKKQLADSLALCRESVRAERILIMPDVDFALRFKTHPALAGNSGVRFYASHVIYADTGRPVGKLSMLASQRKALSEAEHKALAHFVTLIENSWPMNCSVQPDRDKRFWLFSKFPSPLNRIASVISRRWVAVFFAFGFGCSVLYAVYNSEQKSVRAWQSNIESEAYRVAGNLRGTIETELNARLHLTYGLAGLVQTEQKVSDDSFQTFAQMLGRDMPSVSSLQLAPDGVIRYVWPLERHRKAVGHDLLADPTRRNAAMSAINTGKIWLAGPVELLQGGTAIIGRYPIVKGELQQQFWGFATVLIDFEQFKQETGMLAIDPDFEVAIRGVDAQGEHGEVFFGDRDTFAQQWASADINLPAGAWVIAVKPSAQALASRPKGSLLLWTLPALVMSISLYWLLRLPRKFEKAVSLASQALKQSEIRFRDAIESLADGFVIFNNRDELVTSNKKYKDLYPKCINKLFPGKAYETILRYGVQQKQFVIPANETAEQYIARRLKEHLDTDKPFEEQLSDGRWIRLEQRKLDDGGTVALYTDITSMKKNQQALAEAKDRAEAANQAKSAFLATMSHEVRTPMNVIMGILSLLAKDDGLNDKQQNYLNTASNSAFQLLHILNEVLDLSKVEAGKLVLDEHIFNLNTLCLEVLNLCEVQAQEKNLQLCIELNTDNSLWVKADQGRLRQILFNLLNNAIKFTDQGVVKLTSVVQSCTADTTTIDFLVSDTGIGFDQIEATKLFQPFSQLDNSASRRHEGAGLGLSICYRIVQLMGGGITASGRKGQGAEFRVSLPFTLVSTHQAAVGSLQPLPLLSTRTSPAQILIAEDSLANQMVFNAMLADGNYNLTIVNNGKEAVSAALKNDFDLILMDIYMPEMDGIEAAMAIRSAVVKRMPILALTANAMKGDKERFVKAGMDDCISKPVSKEVLVERINWWLDPPLPLV